MQCIRDITPGVPQPQLEHLHASANSPLQPMGNELKLLLKEGAGWIFKSWDVPTSHAVSLALFMYADSDPTM